MTPLPNYDAPALINRVDIEYFIRWELRQLLKSAFSSIKQFDPSLSDKAPPIPLSINQRIAQREVLCHANHRIVDRRVAVRMVRAKYIADDVGRFLVRLAGHQPLLVH